MNRLHIVLLIIGLIVTNVFAGSPKIAIAKKMELPFYKEKNFQDLANALENAKWEGGANENVIKLSGFFYVGKREKAAKVTLNYTIVLNSQNGLKEMTIVDFAYKKDELIKIHKWAYKSDQWRSAKWRSYDEYQKNPDKTYDQERTERARKFFKEQLYPALFR